MQNSTDRDNKQVALKLSALVLVMFGFGFVLVPLYDIFCEVTGLNGKPGVIGTSEVERLEPDFSREIVVEFVTSIGANTGNWSFEPKVRRVTVNPGALYTAYFRAENLTDLTRVAQAVPSVAPGLASKYFDKTECFCFTQQQFAANEGRDMPVTFVINPQLPKNVSTVTLSYTFFASQATASSVTPQQATDS